MKVLYCEFVVKPPVRRASLIQNRVKVAYTVSRKGVDIFTVQHLVAARMIQRKWKALKLANKKKSRLPPPSPSSGINFSSAFGFSSAKINLPPTVTLNILRVGHAVLKRLDSMKYSTDRRWTSEEYSSAATQDEADAAEVNQYRIEPENNVDETEMEVQMEEGRKNMDRLIEAESEMDLDHHDNASIAHSDEEFNMEQPKRGRRKKKRVRAKYLDTLLDVLPLDEDDVALVTTTRRKPRAKKTLEGTIGEWQQSHEEFGEEL